MQIKFATIEDVSLILEFIKELANYEKLLDQVVTTEEILKENLFGDKKYAEVVFAYYENKPVGYALFFHNFSTFLGKPGLHLEDLYVKPEFRGKKIATQILAFLAKLAKQRDCGRLEWSVLDWNKKAIDFYLNIGAAPMDEWTVFRITGEKLDTLANSTIFVNE
ncbi:MAG: family N-acetyltransferase [Burkholderiales bacterium]|jgi:GNAT superfamily N-acetyltransferase|nr:family N-acetyltransferase [Burkholderiales bacterium]